MKNLIYAILLVSAFSACQNRPKEALTAQTPSIVGTWHYETLTYILQHSAGADTIVQHSTQGTVQNYDNFMEDSTLISYTLKNDSVISRRVYKFRILNDSVVVTNDTKSASTHIVELADSTLTMDFIRSENDTICHTTTISRRSPLPAVCK